MKRYLTALILLLASFLPLYAAETTEVDVNHFLIYPTVNGGSGFIYNPSAYVAPDSRFTLGLHRFIFKANYGIMETGEVGINIDFGSSTNFLDIIKGTAVNAKLMFLKEADSFVSVAAGMEKFPIDVFEKTYMDRFKLYLVASKKFNDMNFTVGIKKKTGAGDFNMLSYDFMADVSKVINDTMLAVVEFDEKSFNAGVKISLNYNLNVEFYVKDIAHIGDAGEIGNFIREFFIFGIAYIQ